MAPMGVEPTEPRFSCSARYLHLTWKHSDLKMDGVSKVTQCSLQEAHQVSMDLTSGFNGVPLHPNLWAYFFKMYWKGVYYVWISCVSDGVNHHTFAIRSVAPFHNISAN